MWLLQFDDGVNCLGHELCNKVVFAMDAIFGLPRKKSAGISFRPPLHQDLFFHDQTEVDQFVMERGMKKSAVAKDVSVLSYTIVVFILSGIL